MIFYMCFIFVSGIAFHAGEKIEAKLPNYNHHYSIRENHNQREYAYSKEDYSRKATRCVEMGYYPELNEVN